MIPVLLDTGVIVALMDRSESRHRACVRVVERLERPLVTCEAVIAESCYLLRRFPGERRDGVGKRRAWSIPGTVPALSLRCGSAKDFPEVSRSQGGPCRCLPGSARGRTGHGRYPHPGPGFSIVSLAPLSSVQTSCASGLGIDNEEAGFHPVIQMRCDDEGLNSRVCGNAPPVDGFRIGAVSEPHHS